MRGAVLDSHRPVIVYCHVAVGVDSLSRMIVGVRFEMFSNEIDHGLSSRIFFVHRPTDSIVIDDVLRPICIKCPEDRFVPMHIFDDLMSTMFCRRFHGHKRTVDGFCRQKKSLVFPKNILHRV